MRRADTGHRGGRVLALVVPAFPLAAILRRDADLAGRAVAVVDGRGTSSRIVAASRPARHHGVHTGMGVARARVLLPGLLVLPRDPEAERSAGEALLEAAASISPRVEDGGPGLAHVDLQGTERTAPSERHLARRALRALRRRTLHARAGVASTRLVARLAASRTDDVVVIPPGEEAAFLDPLPVELLGPSRTAVERFRQWGVLRIGDLARLPLPDLVARIGREGVTLHHAARGIDPAPFLPVPLPDTVREGFTLDWPVDRLGHLLAGMQDAVERVASRLLERGRGCRLLELELELETGEHLRRAIRLPRPTAEGAPLLDLAGLELERRPPHAPVTAVAVIAHPAGLPHLQGSLFGPEELAPQRTASALSRIAATLGPGGVGSPAVPNTPVPSAPELVPFDPPSTAAFASGPAPPPGFLAFRRLDPPRPIEVATDDRNGRPLSVRTPSGSFPTFRGTVRGATGPWEFDTGWWETGTVLTAWDVELPHGVLLRIFHDASGAWHLAGIYD